MEDLLKVNDQTEKNAWRLQVQEGTTIVAPPTCSRSAVVSSSVRRVRTCAAICPGISKVALDGTLYDQVLDWVFALGLAPARFSKLSGYDLYFAMARGTEGAVALDMSKFFDTNYHYMVRCPLVDCMNCDPFA